MHYGDISQKMMHNGPMPGSMPPTPYSPYPPMQNMQPYSPCTPMQAMTPMNSYPSCPSVPPPQQQQMCHPAYQQPPQLPGGYPCSPGRRPNNQQSHQAYVADWMDPSTYNNYSPAPSVAPSMMSHASHGAIPCDAQSNMSIPSTIYSMDCNTPDMRPNSVISSASYSENVDPLHSMIPGMPPTPQHLQPPPPQPQPQNLQQPHRQRPTFPQLLENVFRNPELRGEFVTETVNLTKELQKRKNSGQKIPVECYEYAKFLPRILVAIMNWQLHPKMNQRLAFCYKAIVNCLPEDAVLQQIFQAGIIQGHPGQEACGMHIQMLAQLAVWPDYASYLLHPLNTIVAYKTPKKSLRGYLRHEGFLKTLVYLLSSPKAIPLRPQEYMYVLSILSWLAHSEVETQKKLLAMEPIEQDGQKVLKNGMKGIVGVIFGACHQRCLTEISQGKSFDDPKVLDALKVVRQMTALLLIIGFAPFSPTVASQIIEYNGLDIIAGYLHLLHQNGRTSKEYLILNGLKILRLSCQLKGTTPRVERLSTLPSPQGFLEKILGILATCDYRKSEDFELTEQLTQIIYSVVFASQGVRTILSQDFFFSRLVFILDKLYRAQQALRCPKDGLEQWKRYRILLDCEDTVLLTIKALFQRCPEIGRTVQPESARNMLAVVVAQTGDVPSWQELPIVQVVLSSIQTTCCIFKALGGSVPSAVLLNTDFDNRNQNLLGNSCAIAQRLQEVAKEASVNKQLHSEDVARKLSLIVPSVFELLTVIWNSYDPQREGYPTVRNAMKSLISTYTLVIYWWLECRKELKDLKVFLIFCETVVSDDEIAKCWSNCSEIVEYFESMSCCIDADISRLCTNIRERIAAHNSSFSSDMCQAMTYGMSM